MARSKNTRLLAHIDCPGGGARSGSTEDSLHRPHARARPARPSSTSRSCRTQVVLARVAGAAWLAFAQGDGSPMASWWRTTSARARTAMPSFGGGLGHLRRVDAVAAGLLCKWRTDGKGVHRYDFDGRYAYISRPPKATSATSTMILDLKDPAPLRREVGPLVDPGTVGRRAVRPIPGPRARRRAATTPCAWATALCELLAPRRSHPRHRAIRL